MLKKILFFPGLLALLLFTACEPKDELTPVLLIGPAPAISSPAAGTNLVLEEANADNVMPDFTWSAADYGFQAAVNYSLQMAKAGTEFADPILIGTTKTTQISGMTVGEFNAILIANGIADGVAAPLELRVKAEVNPKVDPVYSATLAMDVTPYKVVVIYPQLQVPGSYQGWAPEDSSTAIYSRRSDNKYEGYIYMDDAAAKFKFTVGPGWDTNYGDTGADGTLDAGGDDISTPGAGMIKLNADLNALTYTAVVTDWGLIGDATPGGWDNDTDMVYDPATNTLKLTTQLGTGAIKFRANDGWDINLGDNDGNLSLEYGGADIIVSEAGNYTVELIITGPDYTYKLTKN